MLLAAAAAAAGGLVAVFRWIEVTSNAPIPENHLILRDRNVPGENRSVMFSMLSGSATAYRLPIGACAQWHAYAAAPLLLTGSGPLHVASIRLQP